MLGAGMHTIGVPANDVQASEVDPIFLNEGHLRTAGKSDGPTIVLESHHRFFVNKIFDRDNRDLNVSILEWNVELRPIGKLVGNDDLPTVGDVTTRCIAVANPALGSMARTHAMSRKGFGAIRNGNERAAVDHRPNPSRGFLDRPKGAGSSLYQRSKLVKVLVLNLPKCFC